MTEDPDKRWEICAPVGGEAKEMQKSVAQELAEQKKQEELRRQQKEERRKAKQRADAQRTYVVTTSTEAKAVAADPQGDGDVQILPVLLVATLSFCGAIICTTTLLCCCCGNPKVGSGASVTVKPKPTPRPSPRDALNQSLNSSINSIASILTPRS